jgi:hypothetical protein
MNETNSLLPAHRSGLDGRGNVKLLNSLHLNNNFLGAFAVLLALAVALPLNRAWAADPAKPQKDLPLPGEVFEVGGRTAFVILPAVANRRANRPIPWVWYAPTLPNTAALFQDPPMEARPGAFWAWMNGNVDLDRITYELEEIKNISITNQH